MILFQSMHNYSLQSTASQNKRKLFAHLKAGPKDVNSMVRLIFHISEKAADNRPRLTKKKICVSPVNKTNKQYIMRD